MKHLKYAFQNGSKGHIWIDFRPKGNSMHLTFDDDGIGLPDGFDLEETQSLGLQLVRLLTVHDLHGRIELGNGHKKGARFLIEFPLSILENECVDIM